jgi:hypothetical protein
MNVTSAPTPVASPPLDTVEAKRAQLQVALLRKTLDAQQEQAEQMTRMMQGKGQIVDIRV